MLSLTPVGVVVKLQGADRDWSVEREEQLGSGPVTSVSLSQDGTFLLAGTGSGSTFRLSTADLAHTKIGDSHTGSIVAVSFDPHRSDVFW